MIYDCFIFYNELDILEMRFNILGDVVDRFVIVEASKTFSGRDKELYFKSNKERFRDFIDRVIYVCVNDFPPTNNRWQNEWYQRNSILKGLEDADPDDIIMISDVDEIPDPNKIPFGIKGGHVGLEQKMYYYYLNLRSSQWWVGTVVSRFADLVMPQVLRDRRETLPVVREAGWHFSFLGGVEQIINKIESFSHAEYDRPFFKDPKRLLEKIQRGEDLFERGITFSLEKIDESYPAYIRNNQDRYKRYIKTVQKSDAHILAGMDHEPVFKDNLEVLKLKDPELAERIIHAPHDNKMEVKVNNIGGISASVRGISLHSRYKPEEEAELWVKRHKDKLKNVSVVYVLGFGCGYHVERLMKATDAEIVVFEPSVGLLKEVMRKRDIRDLLKRVMIVDSFHADLPRKGFAVLEHSPSVRLNPSFYRKVRDKLEVLKGLLNGLKVAVVGPIYGGSLPIAGYAVRALEKIGHNPVYIDNSVFQDVLFFINSLSVQQHIRATLQKEFMNFVSSTILARCEDERPDLLIALAQAPLTVEALQKLGMAGLKTAFWFVENYRHMGYWKDIAGCYDYFFVIQRGEWTKAIEKFGSYTYYLPLAASTEIHRVVELTEEEKKFYGSKVSFVGAGYRNRRSFFLGLMDMDLKIWGNEWDLASPLGRFIQNGGERVGQDEMVKIFNASEINLNLHSSAVHDGIEPDGDFVNPRTFEIPACGGFELVDERTLLRELFEPGQEIVCYKDIDDLRKKIKYYLGHPDEREDIVRAGRERVYREHTYEDRLDEMMQYIVEHGFDLPAWTSERAAIDNLISKTNDLPELKSFLLKAASTMSDDRPVIEALASTIKVGGNPLSDAEKLILLMNQMRKQYIKEEIVN